MGRRASEVLGKPTRPRISAVPKNEPRSGGRAVSPGRKPWVRTFNESPSRLQPAAELLSVLCDCFNAGLKARTTRGAPEPY